LASNITVHPWMAGQPNSAAESLIPKAATTLLAQKQGGADSCHPLGGRPERLAGDHANGCEFDFFQLHERTDVPLG
jgi:hypothetical protein